MPWHRHRQREHDRGPAAVLARLAARGEQPEAEDHEADSAIENENSPAIVRFTLPP